MEESWQGKNLTNIHNFNIGRAGISRFSVYKQF